ncbi:hypothetical protein ACIOWB_09485 [Pseudomonas capeferrum]|uniref:hypothetical protein n=2 Tax=Pseudomonas TaxID=286 RepID=UPI003821BE8E
MNEVTCIVFICDEIGPTALVAQRNGQGGYLGFLERGRRQGGSAGCDQECAVRKRVTGKTRRTVYPCKRAGVNALRHFPGEKRSVPVVKALKGEVIGVHGASICCFVSTPLWAGFCTRQWPLYQRAAGVWAIGGMSDRGASPRGVRQVMFTQVGEI